MTWDSACGCQKSVTFYCQGLFHSSFFVTFIARSLPSRTLVVHCAHCFPPFIPHSLSFVSVLNSSLRLLLAKITPFCHISWSHFRPIIWPFWSRLPKFLTVLKLNIDYLSWKPFHLLVFLMLVDDTIGVPAIHSRNLEDSGFLPFTFTELFSSLFFAYFSVTLISVPALHPYFQCLFLFRHSVFSCLVYFPN